MALKSDLFAWPAFQGATSTPIPDPQDWADGGVLIPHELIRWYHSNLREILPKIEADPVEWRAKNLLNWLVKYYIAFVHHHHDAEENIYNPAIVAKGGQLKTDEISSDHKILMVQLETLQTNAENLFEEVRGSSAESSPSGKAAPLAAKLHKDALELMDAMDAHIMDEERQYPTALRASMTEEEEGKLVGEILAGLGLEGNKIALPAVLYVMCMWKGEPKMQEFYKAGVPPPIRMLNENCWLDDFFYMNLNVLNALKADTPFEPITPQCGMLRQPHCECTVL